MSESAIAQLFSGHHFSRDQEKARRQRPFSKYLGTSLSPGSRRSIRPGADSCIQIEVHEPSPDSRWSATTPRQFKVLECLVEGRPTKTICKMLDMSSGTDKIHIGALFRALKARGIELRRLLLPQSLAGFVPCMPLTHEAARPWH